jgi:hypothetical protein
MRLDSQALHLVSSAASGTGAYFCAVYLTPSLSMAVLALTAGLLLGSVADLSHRSNRIRLALSETVQIAELSLAMIGLQSIFKSVLENSATVMNSSTISSIVCSVAKAYLTAAPYLLAGTALLLTTALAFHTGWSIRKLLIFDPISTMRS